MAPCPANSRTLGLAAVLLLVLSAPHSQAALTDLVAPRLVNFTSLTADDLAPAPWPLPTNASPPAAPTFVITATCCGYGPYTAAAVASASDRLGLFDVPCLPPAWPVLAEWGYEFENNKGGAFPVCGNLTEAGYALPPLSREQALQRLELYWRCRAADARAGAPPGAPLVSEIGHYLYAGQSAAFPNAFPVLPGSEIGENINSINLHLAATRGAARAHSTAWLIDFSSWFAGFILDYSAQQFWGAASSPTGGHSLSLHRRSMYAAFMGGAGCYVAEAGAVNYFQRVAPPPAPQDALALSPLGAVGAEFYAFTHAPAPEAARGVPYVPVALLAEASAGLGLGFFYQQRSWDVFPLSESELRLGAHLQALWPNSFTVESQIGSAASESLYMVAGREAVDVVVRANLTAAGLARAYRAVFFSTAGAVDAQLAAVLQGYVEAGGCAIVAADDAAAAAASGWFSAGFLGLDFAPAPAQPLALLSVTDLQTGWVGSCSGSTARSSSSSSSSQAAPPARFCAPQQPGGGGAYYIKTGGDPATGSGWDPAAGDKCCSTDAGDCLWFPSADACAAALASAPCRACACGSGGSDDVGCPAWAPPPTPPASPYFPAALAGSGQALLALQPAGGGAAVLGAVENAWGGAGGRVVTLLAPGAAAGSALGLVAHLLSRALNDTLPFYLASNVSTDAQGTGGVQSLFNALPGGRWAVTLINNRGVSKQPGAPAALDAGAGRAVRLSLLQGAVGQGARVAAVSARDGGAGGAVPVPWVAGSCVVEVPAGGLRVVEVQLQ